MLKKSQNLIKFKKILNWDFKIFFDQKRIEKYKVRKVEGINYDKSCV